MPDVISPEDPQFESNDDHVAIYDAIRQIAQRIADASDPQKLAVGGVLGWAAGALVVKVGTVVAYSLRYGVLLFQVSVCVMNHLSSDYG
ncbi:unnamed protein product [Soboliphyme baturini]|uniref:MICOS complex subunit MIC10 n=1 Tax=Soboliphyme baturini TaxID=241478 RepID=A0A183J4V6_9BILA|nr:unnamed protein product [Soboliphyme baturini]